MPDLKAVIARYGSETKAKLANPGATGEPGLADSWSLAIEKGPKQGRPLIRDEDAIDVSLNAGCNVLVFKVVHETGGWAGCIRFVDRTGLPAKGIRVSLTPE